MRLHLTHRTTFVYDGSAHDSFNECRLQPPDTDDQKVLSFELTTAPAARLQAYRDYFGNHAHRFSIASPHPELIVEAQSELETLADAGRAKIADSAADAGDFDLEIEFIQPSRYVPLDPELCAVSAELLPTRGLVWDSVLRVCSHVHRTLVYRPQATGVETVATEALKLRAGVCQDFAHVALGLCRSAGIPARYVSGYFFNGEHKPGQAEASHAWIEAVVPGTGWVGYDPTHDRRIDQRYIRLAVGRDYADIRPIAGTYRGLPTREMRVEVTVRDLATMPTGPV